MKKDTFTMGRGYSLMKRRHCSNFRNCELDDSFSAENLGHVDDHCRSYMQTNSWSDFI
jgi:hypothetical protein